MDFTQTRTIRAIAALLIIAALSQSVYTALAVAKMEVPRQLLWGSEGVLFAILAALAGAAMARSERLTLVFSAIAFSAALNVVQVGVGLALFGPFGEAAGEVPALGPVADAIVAYSFFVYNAAKLLLGLAALVAGLALMARGGNVLGGAAALVGGLAMIANGGKMVAGGDLIAGVPLAGGTGVLATLLLAVCLLRVKGEE
jgi:hypothetical protein